MQSMSLAEFKSLPQIKKTGKEAVQALGRLKTGEMNKLEARYDAYLRSLLLAGQIAWYKFEGIKLRLADNTYLTVDFFVMYNDGHLEAHDTKGTKRVKRADQSIVLNAHVEDDASVKMKVAAEEYPWPFRYAIELPKKLGGGWKLIPV